MKVQQPKQPDSGKTNQLFFDAGPNHPGDSTGGLFGVIRAAGGQGGNGGGSFERAAADRGAGGLAGALPDGSARAGQKNSQTVYVLTETNTLKPVSIRTGISDGHYTQVVSGDLQPGQKIVTGLATLKVNVSGTSGRPPGIGRF